jgi:hypothetical protein
MRSIRAKWFFAVLAVILNLGGGPMAWAHLAPAEQTEGGCHEQQAAPAEPTHEMPCCDASSCECATPPAPLAVTLDAPADLRHSTLRAPPVTRLIAPDPLDDTLRPPIR